VKLEYAEKRMKQRWYDLVMAEQRGATEQVLEDLYSSYMQALEEYNRCSEAYQRESQGKWSASLVKQKKTA
jgi:DNA-binding transcriptional regulator YbjK